ncbi:MAG: M23 family metallopeptidase [Candidatus Paceibacterota bacterium]
MNNKLFVLFLLLLINSYAFAVKPIDGLPDYNGTYFGSPNTGSLYDESSPIFTTLWRDNYYRSTANCAGEGCGKHPGVDIAVPSGTEVRASLSGRVHRKLDCDAGWGGLVVIEADNPYKSGEKVYISYAHLRDIFVSLEDIVSTGDIIGESGGALTDPCHGTSTGAHLHFQVDKPHSGNYPWYPFGRSEYPDSDFEVTEKTYNPLPFVQGYGYHWTFGEDGFKELWGAYSVNDYGVDNSYLWIDSESTYASITRSGMASSCAHGDGYQCSRSVAIEADLYKLWVLNLDFECDNNPVVVYFKNSDGKYGGLAFNYDSARKYYLPMNIHSLWTGTITGLWLFPSDGCSAPSGNREFYIHQMYFLH